MDFESFLKILNRPNGFRDPGEPDEFVRGFQVFDKDLTGYIGVGELRYGRFTNRWSQGAIVANGGNSPYESRREAYERGGR